MEDFIQIESFIDVIFFRVDIGEFSLYFFLLFCLVVLGFELRASCLIQRNSTSSHAPKYPFFLL
jgi:hypothetical protein